MPTVILGVGSAALTWEDRAAMSVIKRIKTSNIPTCLRSSCQYPVGYREVNLDGQV